MHFPETEDEKPGKPSVKSWGKVYSLLESHKTIAADSSTTVLEKASWMLLQKRSNGSDKFCSRIPGSGRCIPFLETGGVFNARLVIPSGERSQRKPEAVQCRTGRHQLQGTDDRPGVNEFLQETEAETKKVMLGQAREVALLADHTKFNQMVFVHLVDLDQINYILTDRKPDEPWVEYRAEHGIRLIY